MKHHSVPPRGREDYGQRFHSYFSNVTGAEEIAPNENVLCLNYLGCAKFDRPQRSTTQIMIKNNVTRRPSEPSAGPASRRQEAAASSACWEFNRKSSAARASAQQEHTGSGLRGQVKEKKRKKEGEKDVGLK